MTAFTRRVNLAPRQSWPPEYSKSHAMSGTQNLVLRARLQTPIHEESGQNGVHPHRYRDMAITKWLARSDLAVNPDSSCFPTHPPMKGHFKPVFLASLVYTRQVKPHSSRGACRVRRVPGQESANAPSLAQTDPAHEKSALIGCGHVIAARARPSDRYRNRLRPVTAIVHTISEQRRATGSSLPSDPDPRDSRPGVCPCGPAAGPALRGLATRRPV